MANIHSPFRYQGSKFKLIDFLRDNIQLSENTLWIEPFLGSGTVLLNIAPKQAIGSDLNPYLIEFFKLVTKSKFLYELENKLALYGRELFNSGDEVYYKIRETFNQNPNVFDFVFLNHTCFNGLSRFNQQGKFNAPFSKNIQKLNSQFISSFIEKCKIVSEKIKSNNWIFECSDYREIFKKYDSQNTIFYLDPPYFKKSTGYISTWIDNDTFILLNEIEKLKGSVVISSWKNESEDNILNYIRFPYKMISKEYTYAIGGKKERRNQIEEILIIKDS